ncbi:hypothetical protein B566_EDAN013429 [Ephemera danica]|nr:hypothetical protein B566_EDAN013429 [Ephemera danica]
MVVFIYGGHRAPPPLSAVLEATNFVIHWSYGCLHPSLWSSKQQISLYIGLMDVSTINKTTISLQYNDNHISICEMRCLTLYYQNRS